MKKLFLLLIGFSFCLFANAQTNSALSDSIKLLNKLFIDLPKTKWQRTEALKFRIKPGEKKYELQFITSHFDFEKGDSLPRIEIETFNLKDLDPNAILIRRDRKFTGQICLEAICKENQLKVTQNWIIRGEEILLNKYDRVYMGPVFAKDSREQIERIKSLLISIIKMVQPENAKKITTDTSTAKKQIQVQNGKEVIVDLNKK